MAVFCPQSSWLQLQILFYQEQFQVRLFLLPAIPSTPTLVHKQSGLSGGEGGVEGDFGAAPAFLS